MLKVDVSHVHAKTRRLRVLLVFENNRVAVERLLIQVVGMVHVRQVVKHIERQIDIDLVEPDLVLPLKPIRGWTVDSIVFNANHLSVTITAAFKHRGFSWHFFGDKVGLAQEVG